MTDSLARFFDGTNITAPRKVKGTMSAFGYDYFADHYKGPALKLGEEHRYEALNLYDGKRSVREITDMLSAIHGPAALEDVRAYLDALVAIGVISPLGDNAP
jgi:aminopeptidase YwaD